MAAADWKMTQDNPSQNDLKKWAAYCSAQYSATTDTVWKDDLDQTVSMAKIFPKPDGQLGSLPGIFVPALPTAADMADAVKAITEMARYKREMDHVASIQKHMMSKSVNISQMLVKTISPAMLTLLRSTTTGINILDNLSEPLPIINYIMSTDYSAGSQLITDPVDKYFQAKSYFESAAVKQKDTGESSTVFAVRFNAEFQKVGLLANIAGVAGQLPDDQVLTYMFLGKMAKRYDAMKADYEKGVRQKPTTINGVIVHALYWDSLPSATVSVAKYSPAEKAAYALQVQNNKAAKGFIKSNSKPAVIMYKCRMHKTDKHEYNDPTCMKARAEWNAKKAAEKVAEKTA
jgi:hypothetical protein